MNLLVRKARAGFTIVEMLVVIAILGVLVTIVTTAAGSFIRSARDSETKALKDVVRGGILAYKNQKGCYPPRAGALQKWADSGLGNGRHVDYLSNSEYDQMMQEIVSVTLKYKSPVFDPLGLIVVSTGGADKPKTHGQKLREAVKKNKRHGSTLTLSSMRYGYAESSQGYFRRFVVKYNGDTDDVTVMTQGEYNNATGRIWPNKP